MTELCGDCGKPLLKQWTPATVGAIKANANAEECRGAKNAKLMRVSKPSFVTKNPAQSNGRRSNWKKN